MQTVQSRLYETNPQADEAQADPLLHMAEDVEKLRGEILALYASNLPPAVVHKIARGAQEQAAISRMMLDDCSLRANNGTLNPKHLANARKWNASVRRWIAEKKAAYASGSRRKLQIVRSSRPVQ
ncbi:MAG TPA: hypothetical protein PL193_14450 [Xanthobacteraceae bacterium]|nr:hypothetical protein [Xanthobacteraceae bacterium]